MSHNPAYAAGARGFTLIELSIVLVIIGLIVGGVLVGRDLIHQAEIRATLKQLEQFNVGVQAFRLKYNCLPGDCNASALSAFGFDAASAGDGDWIIGQCSALLAACYFAGPTPPVLEHYNFWHHLSQANMIANYFPVATVADLPTSTFDSRIGIKTPESKIKAMKGTGGWWIQTDVHLGDTSSCALNTPVAFPHAFVLGTLAPVWSGGVLASLTAPGGFLPFDAYSIDAKIDDANPLGGTVIAWRGASTTCNVMRFLPYVQSGAGGAPTCIRDDTPTSPDYNRTYDGSDPEGQCSLIIKASF